MTIENFVPKTRTSIDNLGFIFGAGTSFESGYPLVSGLTKEVVGAFTSEERDTLDEVLEAFENTYDESGCTPNIEEISDMVVEQFTNSQNEKFAKLRERIRSLIRDVILGVVDPDLSNQVMFFEGLKARTFGNATDIWIFTTNYDLLLEDACAEVGLKMVNGFNGATRRYFSEREFSLLTGTTHGREFTRENGLTVRIVKLHGSVSWFRNGAKIFEESPAAINRHETRCMVLPRRTKEIETLSAPYNQLFRRSSSVIGGKCKHLVSAGFSFGDRHINETIIVPKINSNSVSLVNFCEIEPSALNSLRSRANVAHVCKDKTVTGGIEKSNPNDTWRFGEFVKLF